MLISQARNLSIDLLIIGFIFGFEVQCEISIARQGGTIHLAGGLLEALAAAAVLLCDSIRACSRGCSRLHLCFQSELLDLPRL